MEIKFRLKTDSVNSSGESPVIIDVHYNGLRIKLSTGERCLEKDWDKKKERFRRSFDGWLSSNELLENLANRLKVAYRESLSRGIVPTAEYLRELLKPKKELAKKPLAALYKQLLIDRRVGVSIGTHKRL